MGLVNRWIALVAVLGVANCATLGNSTQRIMVSTDPPGAKIAVFENGVSRDLGPAPVEIKQDYQAYHCTRYRWLIPVGTTLAGAALGGGLAYATTARNDKWNSAGANGAFLAAIGLALGTALAVNCANLDGTTPEHRDTELVISATKENAVGRSVGIKIPSSTTELNIAMEHQQP